jgi:hypothetical protein
MHITDNELKLIPGQGELFAMFEIVDFWRCAKKKGLRGLHTAVMRIGDVESYDREGAGGRKGAGEKKGAG